MAETAIAALIGAALMLGPSGPAPAAVKTQAEQSRIAMSSANTARDGKIAIKEEYDAAVAADTVAGYEMFIARHPESDWTEAARARLQKVRNAKD